MQALRVDFLAFLCYIFAVLVFNKHTMKIAEISDEKLLELCAHWGHQLLQARYKFVGLLPEVNRRRLYEKKDSYRSLNMPIK